MKIATLIAGLGLGALVLSGCGGSSSGNPKSPATITTEQAHDKLIGIWNLVSTKDKSSCLKYEGTDSEEYQIVFKNDTLNENIKLYHSSNCKQNLYKDYTIIYSYEISASKERKDGKYVFLGTSTKTGFTGRKGTFNGKDISTGQTRGFAILFKTNDTMVVEDGSSSSINNIDVNDIKFSKEYEFARQK